MANGTPKTLAQSIDDYINRGFGSMNKNDFEIFIFNEYLKEPGNSKLGDYELSLKLRIPKAKVRRLRYEASLKYPVSEDMLRNLLDDSLQYARIVPNSVRCIEINVENESVRQYVNALLKKEHRFSDGSFSSEILRLSADDYEYLAKNIYGDKEVKEVTGKLLSSPMVKGLGLSAGKRDLKDIITAISRKITSAVQASLKIAEIVNAIDSILNILP